MSAKSKLRDTFRPLFRTVVHPHIVSLCESTLSELHSYKDKYKGKRCFVVANGPSLRMEDVDRIAKNGDISFGMNRIYVVFDRTIWRPTFYVGQDPTIIRASREDIINKVDSVKFIKSTGEKKYDIPGVINIDIEYKYSSKLLDPPFLTDIEYKFSDGLTVTYTCLQLAVYMGFSEIYLLGTDCNYSVDNKSINKNSYADARMFSGQTIGMPPNIEYNFRAYESANRYAQEHGIKMCNATRGGKLEAFPRVNFDDLF